MAPRLRERKGAAPRLPTALEVPFTNSPGEQDPRILNLRMKIAGCFRTERGARHCATLRSVLSAARKQGTKAIGALLTPPDELFAGLKP